MRSFNKGELAVNILWVLAGLTAAASLAVVFSAVPGLAYIYKIFDTRNKYDEQRIRQAVKRLERRGFVEVRKRKNGEEYIVLTPIGRDEALMRELEYKRLPKPTKWDKRWRLVMFDIPEKQKQSRNAIHHTLNELGMYHLQKSIFVYPYECKHEVDFVAKYFKVNKHICHATALHIEKGRALRKYFKLT